MRNKRKGILRKFLSKASRRNNQYIRFRVDLVSPIKEKERILGTKAALKKYHLVVVVVEMGMTVVAVRRNRTKGSLGISKPVEK